MEDDFFSSCNSTSFTPNGLMDHLKNVGGLFEHKQNRDTEQEPLKCEFHHAAKVFLENLFGDYHGSGEYEISFQPDIFYGLLTYPIFFIRIQFSRA